MKIRDLDELRVFVQIADSGSLRAAADALKLPSTTVSRRLALLEERLETQLIYRSTRSMHLSEAGQALLQTARSVLDTIAEAEVALEQDKGQLAGVVRIGVVSILSEELLAVLGPLLEAHPSLRVEVQIADRVVNPVAAGIDVAIYGGRLDDSSLVAKKLLEVELVMAATESYLDRNGAPTTLQDLADHDILSFDTGSSAFRFLDRNGDGHVVNLTGRVVTNDARTLRDALIAGLGIGVTSTRVLLRSPHLKHILPDFRLQPIPLFAVYPAAMKRSARIQTVVRYLQEALLDASQIPERKKRKRKVPSEPHR